MSALLAACSSAVDSRAVLRRRAADDLACPAPDLRLERQPDGRQRVVGCGRERYYALVCDIGPHGECVYFPDARTTPDAGP